MLNLGSQPADPNLIKDATIETFADDVLTASMTTPVIVDFWAPWCGPCKQLTPILEKAIKAAKGKVRLVKVDIDKNQVIAQQMRIQSIPAVFAFVNGQPVDGFMGAKTESEIKAFIDRLPAAQGDGRPDLDAMLDEADAAFDAGDLSKAAQVYAQIAQTEQDNLRAFAGLARVYVAVGEHDKARELLAGLPEDKRSDPLVARVEAGLALSESAETGGDAAALAAAVAAAPEDLDLRQQYAEALIAAGDMEGAMTQLLDSIAIDRSWNEEAARTKLLTIFDALGPKDPKMLQARRRLSSILFS